MPPPIIPASRHSGRRVVAGRHWSTRVSRCMPGQADARTGKSVGRMRHVSDISKERIWQVRTNVVCFPHCGAKRDAVAKEPCRPCSDVSRMSVSEIARKHGRSIKTISKQKMDAMRKLGLRTDMGLHRYALDVGC